MSEEIQTKERDYDKLEEALVESVLSPSTTDTSKEFIIDKEGNVVRGGMSTETLHTSTPDPTLILKLLEDRIGGPHDYC